MFVVVECVGNVSIHLYLQELVSEIRRVYLLCSVCGLQGP